MTALTRKRGGNRGGAGQKRRVLFLACLTLALIPAPSCFNAVTSPFADGGASGNDGQPALPWDVGWFADAEQPRPIDGGSPTDIGVPPFDAEVPARDAGVGQVDAAGNADTGESPDAAESADAGDETDASECGVVGCGYSPSDCPSQCPYCCGGSIDPIFACAPATRAANSSLCIRADWPRDAGYYLDDAGHLAHCYVFGPSCGPGIDGICPPWRPYCCAGPSGDWWACALSDCVGDASVCYFAWTPDAGTQ